MNKQYTPFFMRLARLFALFAWLIKLVAHSRKYARMDVKEQDSQTRKLAKNLLDILHVKLHIQGDIPDKISNTLVVANHVSWLDMAAMLALYPVHFVAKTEIQKWPILGNVIRALGSIFIDRSRRKDTEHINQTIADALQEGKNIVFFPEAGTSEDGFAMKPFKAALFSAAIIAGAPVQGIAIRYYEAEQRTRRSAYSRNMSLWRCVWNIVSLPEHTITLDFVPQIEAREVVTMERYEVKEILENAIREVVYEDFPVY